MEFAQAKELLKAYQLDVDMRNACLAVTDVLEQLNPKDGKFLTLSFFYERLENPDDESRLLPALSIHSTFEEAILEVHGFLYDDDAGQIHLDDEAFKELIETDKLVHPETGELVSDPMHHVHLYYSVREEKPNEP